MNSQQLQSRLRQAIDHYQMIRAGDHIAIGLSGGKDSLTLVKAMKDLSRYYPEPFTVSAITVDLGFKGFDTGPVKDFCASVDIPWYHVKTAIGEIVFERRQEKNPCSLCAKMRKGALVDEAVRIGCNKIAYGHHRDDFVETMLMSLIYQSRFYAFPPVTLFEDKGLQIIRPMMYLTESEVKGYAAKEGLPVTRNPCPADKKTRREYCKQLMKQIGRENRDAIDHMFSALESGNLPDWPKT